MIRLRQWIAGLTFFMPLGLLLCPGSAAGGVDQGGEWTYDLYIAGGKVGTCTVASTPARDGTLETRANTKFEVTQGAQKIQVALNGRTTYAWPGGHPRSYDVKITAAAGPESSITAQFGEKQSTVTVDAAGQKVPTTLETKGDEYLLDNNFMVDHYWVLLSSLNPPEGQGMTVKFIVPQIVTRIPKPIEMVLSRAGVETLKVGGVERKALKFSSQGPGLTMDFWLDAEDRTLLRWSVPSQQSEVLLSTVDPSEIKARQK